MKRILFAAFLLVGTASAQWTEGGARIGEHLDTLAVTFQGMGTLFNLQTFNDAADMYVTDTLGNVRFSVWGYGYGGGGQLNLYNASGTRTIILRGDGMGDGSVILPQDAIHSSEISNEAGVSSATNTGSMGPINTGMNVLLQRSIVVPDSGYLMVIATAQIGLIHTNGTSSGASFGVSLDDSTTLPANQDVALYVTSTSPSMSFGQPVTVQGLFQVGPGTHTLYFLADKYSGGSFSAWDGQLSVVYFPTAYGTVTPTKMEPGKASENPLETFSVPAVHTPRGMDEKMQTEQANQARIQAELARIRAQLKQLEDELHRTQK